MVCAGCIAFFVTYCALRRSRVSKSAIKVVYCVSECAAACPQDWQLPQIGLGKTKKSRTLSSTMLDLFHCFQHYRSWVRGNTQCSTTILTYPLDLAEARLHFCRTVHSKISGFIGKHNSLDTNFLTALALSETDPKSESKHEIIRHFLKSLCFTMF